MIGYNTRYSVVSSDIYNTINLLTLFDCLSSLYIGFKYLLYKSVLDSEKAKYI